MNCKKHPKYIGILKPRTECRDCKKIFRTNQKNIKEMQDEINYYNPPKSISNAMMELAQIGFKFSGHGYGGYEDFGVSKEYENGYIYASFSTSLDNSTSVCKYLSEEDDEEVLENFENKRPSEIVKKAKIYIKKYNKESL